MKEMKKSTKILMVAGISLCVAVLAFLAVLTFNIRIYYGVSAGGVSLGGKTVAEAEQILESQGFFDDIPELVCDGVTIRAAADELGIFCDAEKTALKAHDYGRDANIFKRIGNIFYLMFNPVDIPIEVKFDENKLEAVFATHLEELRAPTIEPQIRLEGDKIFITNGRDGLDVSRDELAKDLSDFVYNKEEKIELVIETVNPTVISAKGLHDMFAREAVNSQYTVSNMRISYSPSENGLNFDIAEADKILKDNIKNPEEYSIPVTIVPPEHTAESLDKSMFGDCLGTYTSRYNPAEVGRTRNVVLASDKINNVVLNKGEVFSYNGLVGERTAERGFAGAKVYAGGEVVDGLGGGICQVSSTLYNAVLYADLEVVSRTNHSLPVAYVPLGRDATVSYGIIDFKFTNQYDNPVKISTAVGGGTLTVSVWGKKTTDKKVEIWTERVSSTPFSVKEVEDPNIAEGQTKVKQVGSNGAVVNTYKKVVENGEVIYSKFIHKSTYTPIHQINLVHPKPAEEPTADDPVQETTGEDIITPDSDGEAIETFVPALDVPSSDVTSGDKAQETGDGGEKDGSANTEAVEFADGNATGTLPQKPVPDDEASSTESASAGEASSTESASLPTEDSSDLS